MHAHIDMPYVANILPQVAIWLKNFETPKDTLNIYKKKSHIFTHLNKNIFF